MGYVFYILVKLLSYMAWCWLGLMLLRPGPVLWSKALGFGMLRLAIGIVFGVLIFFLVPVQSTNVLRNYIVIYTPVRLLEWLILAALIAQTELPRKFSSLIPWCLGGIVVSYAADFASPEGVAGHFCVGRCLC